MQASIYIGFDPREAAAFAVARHSIKRHLNLPIPVRGIVLDEMKARGWFWRPQEYRGSQLWDVISDAPCATQFSISRFLTPHLAKQRRLDPATPAWALFMDCDMLVRTDLSKLFDQLNETYAVMCVKHDYRPHQTIKMDGQAQTSYNRKNWSSVCCYNLRHQANDALTLNLINTVTGKALHEFCWLEDKEIGPLSSEWNYLVGTNPIVSDPAIAHFTNGTPDMDGYSSQSWADEWRAELKSWAT